MLLTWLMNCCLMFVPSTKEATPDYFGGLELPYYGKGSVYVLDTSGADDEAEPMLAVSIPVDGWACDELGWEFPVKSIPKAFIESQVAPADDVWWAKTGTLRVERLRDGQLELVFESDGIQHVFTLKYEKSMAFGDDRFASATCDALPVQLTPMPPPDAQSSDCPGGSCNCGQGRCTACCSNGYHPSCSNCGRTTERCACFKNRAGGASYDWTDYQAPADDPAE